MCQSTGLKEVLHVRFLGLARAILGRYGSLESGRLILECGPPNEGRQQRRGRGNSVGTCKEINIMLVTIEEDSQTFSM